MNSIKHLTIFTLLLVFTVGTFVVSQTLVNDDLSTKNSSALYGGILETGYPSAGYLVSKRTDNKFNYCGLVYLGNGKAVTAAHCVDNTEGVLVGFGDFTNNGQRTIANKIFKNTEWLSNKVEKDFAIIQFDVNNFATLLPANIYTPEVSCDYVVVAYGRTEADTITVSLESRPRKSGNICIEKINERSFVFSSDDSGICLGDSGSAIMKKDSNAIVGIVSSIISASDIQDEPCFVGNKAIAVRVDKSFPEFESFSQSTQDFGTEYESQDIVSSTELIEDFALNKGAINADQQDLFLVVSSFLGILTLTYLASRFLNR